MPLVLCPSHAVREIFFDYAGDTVPVLIGRRTREVRDAHLFVAVLGLEPVVHVCDLDRAVRRLDRSSNAAFAEFVGDGQLLVPDNAKVATIRACHFDTMLNRSTPTWPGISERWCRRPGRADHTQAKV